MLKTIIVGSAAAVASGLLFVNLYNSLVDAPNWGADIPNSITAARAYFSVANPGTFFRVFSPINQVLALLVVIVSWKNFRYLAIAVLATALLADVMTFAYFYPRNDVMFVAPIDEGAIRTAWSQWSSMNWLRSLLCVVNTVLAFVLLVSTSKRVSS